MYLVEVLLATNVVSECSESVLRRVKAYPRTSMTLVRLNSINVYQEYTKHLSLERCLNCFVTGNQHRETIFGQF